MRVMAATGGSAQNLKAESINHQAILEEIRHQVLPLLGEGRLRTLYRLN